MPEKVAYIDGREDLLKRLREAIDEVEKGTVAGMAFVLVYKAGGIDPRWAGLDIGPHASTVVRGGVAYLANIMDREAAYPPGWND